MKLTATLILLFIVSATAKCPKKWQNGKTQCRCVEVDNLPSIVCTGPNVRDFKDFKDIDSKTDAQEYEELKIEKTAITSINNGDLGKSTKFRSVIIIDNPGLTKIGPQALTNSINYTDHLIVKNNNELSDTDIFEFVKKAVKLETLDLSHNGFRDVPDNGFNGYDLALGKNKNLKKIDLSYNQITKIGKNAFNNIPAISEINLRNNSITKLGELCFKLEGKSDTHQSTIHLEYNQLIDGIDERAFEYTAGKSDGHKTVHLEYNQLKTLDEKTFKTNIQNDVFAKFYLDGNQFKCDCKMAYIVDHPKAGKVYNNIRCLDRNNQDIYTFSKEKLCNKTLII